MTRSRQFSPSLIPWLRGQSVPAGWKSSKIKYLAPNMQAGESITAESIEELGTYPVYGGNGLRGFTEAMTHSGTRILIGRQGALCGNVHLVEGEFWASEHAIVAEACSDVDARWLAYLLRTMDLGQYSQTVAQPGIGTAQVNALEAPVPPLDEQRAIADFLDRETAQIDTLIEEQQRLIELLRERRQAIIESAVFTGLNGDTTHENIQPWLPRTPNQWPIMQLGFAADTLAGYAFPSEGFSGDEYHIKLLRGVNIKPRRIDWDDVVYWNVEESPVSALYSLQDGDLVLGMDRPFVGEGVRVASISSADTPSLLLQRVMRIRPINGNCQGYLKYLATTGAFLSYLEPLFTGVSVPHISEWQVRKFVMPVPPVAEQRQIAHYLDDQTAKTDNLMAEAEKFIELSRERRSALITAAVTGQIDVREKVTG